MLMGVISFASNLENQTFICQAADKDLIKDKMTFNFLKSRSYLFYSLEIRCLFESLRRPAHIELLRTSGLRSSDVAVFVFFFLFLAINQLLVNQKVPVSGVLKTPDVIISSTDQT